MPRAKDDRKAVGTEHCSECGTIARFLQVQKGNRTGYLYRRCECGADQRSGAAVQVKWLKTMARTDEPMIPHPLENTAIEPAGQVQEPEPNPEPKPAEPRSSSEVNRKTESKKTGLIGVAAMVTAVIVAIST